MPDRSSDSWRSEAALLFVILVWGVNFPIIKSVLDIMHPHLLNALRFIVSAAVLGALYAYQRRSRRQPLWKPLADHPFQIAGLGILGFLIYQLFFILGIDRTTAGNAALIMASSPLWTAVTGFAVRTEHLRRGSWLALLVVLCGAIVIVLGGTREIDLGSNTFVGNLIMLGAAVSWGAYTALNKPALHYVSPTGLTFLGLLFALPVLFGLGAPHALAFDWRQVTWLHWAAILFSGGLSTGLAIAVWNNAVSSVGASNTAVYGNLVPIVALASSYVMLGEAVTISQVLGGVLVIGGLLAMRRARRTPAPAMADGR